MRERERDREVKGERVIVQCRINVHLFTDRSSDIEYSVLTIIITSK